MSAEEGMQKEDIEALAFKTGALLEQFVRYCEQQGQHQTAMAERLQYAIGSVPEQMKQSADKLFSTLPQTVMVQLDSGLSAPIKNYERKLQQSSEQLQERVGQLTRQLAQLESFSRRLVWKVAALVIAALLVAVVGGATAVSYYRDQIKQSQLSADLLHAYNQADVTLCDGQLCANIDKARQKYGEHGQYQPVRLR
ncbi:relaxation protein [Dyella sp. GSA-30]|uniref:relaxation protein n=1 Tax=Dyella sp. GSA-30 TaxID=2994496 RepID=UPI0024928496|nr:relaxation protein [Dyella sp. GSA-30]BDU19836.1 hypothetical protein DYGSA30_12930 [Dyella sp. GSA-30]